MNEQRGGAKHWAIREAVMMIETLYMKEDQEFKTMNPLIDITKIHHNKTIHNSNMAFIKTPNKHHTPPPPTPHLTPHLSAPILPPPLIPPSHPPNSALTATAPPS